jgi:hypothetical protein
MRGLWACNFGGYQVCEKWLQDRKGRAQNKQVSVLTLPAREVHGVGIFIREWGHRALR